MKKILLSLLVLCICISVFAEKLSKEYTSLDIGKLKIESLLNKGVPVIVDFGAEWCGPCKSFHPTLEKMNKEYSGKVIIKYIDIDKHRDLVKGLPVQYVPTQMFWTADGKPYTPSKSMKKNFTQYKDQKTKQIKQTVHIGGMSENDFKSIIKDMGVQ